MKVLLLVLSMLSIHALPTCGILKTEKGVAEFLKTSTNEADYAKKVDEIKKCNNGYPDFWYETVVLSGLSSRIRFDWQLKELGEKPPNPK